MPELEIHHKPHSEPQRPIPWHQYRAHVRHPWTLPLHRVEWFMRHVAWGLSQWSLLQVLAHLSTFSILIAVVFYFHEAPERRQIKQYQAWQVINTSQGKGGSGGRIEALRQLNEDGVPLTGVDASGAFLQSLELKSANLVRANLSAADLRNADLARSNLEDADLHSANFRNADLSHTDLESADLSETDLTAADLSHADLRGANLENATLDDADLTDVAFDDATQLKGATLLHAHNTPPTLLIKARQGGASVD